MAPTSFKAVSRPTGATAGFGAGSVTIQSIRLDTNLNRYRTRLHIHGGNTKQQSSELQLNYTCWSFILCQSRERPVKERHREAIKTMANHLRDSMRWILFLSLSFSTEISSTLSQRISSNLRKIICRSNELSN